MPADQNLPACLVNCVPDLRRLSRNSEINLMRRRPLHIPPPPLAETPLDVQAIGPRRNRLRLKGCLRYYMLVARDNQEAIRFYEARDWVLMDDMYAYGKDLA